MNMIIFVHLFNDQSGSPRVLKSAISSLTKNNVEARLFLGSCGQGILDNCDASKSYYTYNRSNHKVITLFSYIYSQVELFIKLLFDKAIRKDSSIYINTLLPFGAAIFGKLTGRRVIYHLHEVSLSPPFLQSALLKIAEVTASKIIYVSNFHRSALPIPSIPCDVIYNPLDTQISVTAINHKYKHLHDGHFNVLMIASLRDYKGIPEFIALASSLKKSKSIFFTLVLNEDQQTINRYFEEVDLGSNINIHCKTNDPSTFYERASLLLNLSRPDQWIETFGLTLIEAMAFGIPVIGPPVGGPAEIITDGIDGFTIDSRHSVVLSTKVIELSHNEQLCMRMSAAARNKAEKFSYDRFSVALFKAIC